MERVIGVLDAHLKKAGSTYLVGDKCTYADLAFVTWGSMVPWLQGEEKVDLEGKYASYDAWMKRLMERPSVKKVLADKAAAGEKAKAGG